MTCIKWHRSFYVSGYGQCWHQGRAYKAHRVVYCKHHGITLESIKGLVVRHTCDNPPCVNPEHLVIGTQRDNVADMMERGRQVASLGEANGKAKLTESDVRIIRAEYVKGSFTHGGGALGRRFGVDDSWISRIVNNKIWTHLT